MQQSKDGLRSPPQQIQGSESKYAWLWAFALIGMFLCSQLLVLGSPDPTRTEKISSSAGRFEAARPISIAPPGFSVTDYVYWDSEFSGEADGALAYASNINASDVAPSRDSVVALLNHPELGDTDTLRSPATLLFIHSAQSFRARAQAPLARAGVRYLTLNSYESPQDLIQGWIASALAVGDFNPPSTSTPAGTRSEDVVVGFKNRSTLSLVLDPDSAVFSFPALTGDGTTSPVIEHNAPGAPRVIEVPFRSCDDSNDCVSEVYAVTTGFFDDDQLRDIALVAHPLVQYGSQLPLTLYICLQNPSSNITFSCSVRGVIDSEIPGGVPPGGGSGCDKNKGDGCQGNRSYFPESLQIEPVVGADGIRRYLGVYSHLDRVYVFRFAAGSGPQGFSVRTDWYDTWVKSASLWDFDDDQVLDLVVQLQPQTPFSYDPQGNSVVNPYLFPYLEVTRGGSVGVLALGRVRSSGPPNVTYPPLSEVVAGRILVPLSQQRLSFNQWNAPMMFPDYTPLTVGNFVRSSSRELLPNTAPRLEFGIAGFQQLVHLDMQSLGDTLPETSYAAGGVSGNILRGGQAYGDSSSGDFTSGVPVRPLYSFAGEFALAQGEVDGQTPTGVAPLSDLAILTDVAPVDGMRRLVVLPNGGTTQVRESKVQSPTLNACGVAGC